MFFALQYSALERSFLGEFYFCIVSRTFCLNVYFIAWGVVLDRFGVYLGSLAIHDSRWQCYEFKRLVHVFESP